MNLNLLDQIRGYITPDVQRQAAQHFGESETGISNAMGGVIPAILGGIFNRADKDPDGLLRDAQQAEQQGAGLFDGGGLSNLGGLLGGLSGNNTGGAGGGLLGSLLGGNLLGNLFGGNEDRVTDSISQHAGVQKSTTSGLMRLIAPIAMTLLGRYLRGNNVAAGGLGGLFSGQRASLMSALPAGLSLGSLFDGNDNRGTVHATAGTHGSAGTHTTNTGHTGHTTTHGHNDGDDRKRSILPWLLALAGLIALLVALGRGCNDDDTDGVRHDGDTTNGGHRGATMHDGNNNAAGANTTTTGTSTAAGAAAAREMVDVRVMDNVTVRGYKGGFEESLSTCLADAACTPGDTRWFDFDNITFDEGSAKLTANSKQQLQNLAAILKAYPKVKMKVGGYTDKTGNETANMKLSKDRADAVLAALKTEGVTAGQLTGAEGYGSKFAKVAETASEEERRTDRRMALKLEAK